MTFSKLKSVPVLLMLGVFAGCATTDEPATETTSDAQASAEAAIAAAKKAQSEASALGYEWRDTGKLIKQAEAALKAGDYAKAESLANQAKMQAEEAIDQYYLQQAKFKLEKYRDMSGLTDEQQAMLADAEKYYANAQGYEAYQALAELEASLAANRMMYTVTTGDSLWSISAQDGVYGNPYQWPLIFKANADQIKDADLIFPGQELGVDRNPSADSVAKAVTHAKTRGAWSVGEMEASDADFLAQ
jgi:nucleoid-associated protein YgaU